MLLLTQFFPPEVGPAQSRLLRTAQDLQALGHEVVVLTGLPNYPSGIVPLAYRNRLFMRERFDSVGVLRTWLYATPNRGFGRRVLSHISFSAAAALGATRLPWQPEVIAVDLHPIFLCLTALLLSHWWGVPYVINAGDLIPEQAVATGAMTNPIAIYLSRLLANFVYRRAAMLVPFTRGIERALTRRGIPQRRLRLIYYGADTRLFAKVTHQRGVPGVGDDRRRLFVVTYAGSHGLPHGLEAVIDAAALLRARTDIQFRFVGDGGRKEAVMAYARQLGLSNVRFHDPVPHTQMPDIYRDSDVCLVPLRKLEFYREVGLSCKVFEVMAAGRPVIVAADGETAEIVQEARAGLVVPPEVPEALARAIVRLKGDPSLCQELGLSGQRYVTSHFGHDRQAQTYAAVLRAAVQDGGRGKGSGMGGQWRVKDSSGTAADEVTRIRQVYGYYDHDPRQKAKRDARNRGNRHIARERTGAEQAILVRHLRTLDHAEVLDVGCGDGSHLGELLSWGAVADHCHGIDILPHRIAAARCMYPSVDFAVGDARSLPFPDAAFDLVLCSTLFSSILDDHVAWHVANEISRVVKRSGAVLWYDSRYPNPCNSLVRGYGKRDLRTLFPGWSLDLQSITLIPPLARRLGPLTSILYPAFSVLPLLRVRYVGVLQKPEEESSP